MFGSGRRRRFTLVLSAVVLVLSILSAMSAAGAVTLPLPTLPIVGGGSSNGLNDLGALGQGLGQTPARVPTVDRAEPPLTATPLANAARAQSPSPGWTAACPPAPGTTACGAT